MRTRVRLPPPPPNKRQTRPHTESGCATGFLFLCIVSDSRCFRRVGATTPITPVSGLRFANPASKRSASRRRVPQGWHRVSGAQIRRTPLLFRLEILRIVTPPFSGPRPVSCIFSCNRCLAISSANWLILFMIPSNRSLMSMVGRSSLWVLIASPLTYRVAVGCVEVQERRENAPQ